ncbi:aspartyl-phosphate phosphatase Spo0E family protein (plasmid) [Bacillus pumilus]|nr:aspartyl-phosphate phosphatase Spo0E family protein [Bacillus pumilus]QNP18328.1 aspartyl-phosphate phosphatase Spo0E family protein [Bacillus pumilus]
MREIEIMRQEMIRVGFQKGFSHEDTVKISQELDKLICGVMITSKA